MDLHSMEQILLVYFKNKVRKVQSQTPMFILLFFIIFDTTFPMEIFNKAGCFWMNKNISGRTQNY